MRGVKVLDTVLNSPKMEKSRVCRCLFGRPDPEKLREDLDSEMAKLKEENNKYLRTAYNFNAEDDEPLEGRYEWTLVTQLDDIPSVYLKGYSSKHRTITRRRSSTNSGLNTPERSSSPVLSTPEKLTVVETLCNIISCPAAVNEDLRNRLETTPVSRDSSFSSESTSPESAVNDSSRGSRENNRLVQTRIEDFLKVRKRRRLDLDDDQDRPAKSPRLDL